MQTIRWFLLVDTCSGVIFPEDSIDPTAAQQAVAIVADGRLTWGNCQARLLELDGETPARQHLDAGRQRLAAVADFHLAAAWSGGSRPANWPRWQ